MNINIRKATLEDIPFMLSLIKELAIYERAPLEVTTTIESMLKDGFAFHPVYHAHVAEADEKIVGIAVYYVGYSTWKGKMVYLDDLIVTEPMRRYGIGKKLFDAVGKFSKEIGANQLRWHVLDWNTPAIEFYKKLDASLDPTWITCKLTRDQLEKMF